MRFLAPSWDEIYTRSIELASKIRISDQRFDAIVGISKGGLVLARILSDLLEIQDVLITKCEYYIDVAKKKKKPVITQKLPRNIAGKNVLIADDVADTGDSLTEVVKYLWSKNPHILKVATIYVKPWSKVVPDFFVAKTGAWIIFPWELNEAIKSLSPLDGAKIEKTHMSPKYVRMILNISKRIRSTKITHH